MKFKIKFHISLVFEEQKERHNFAIDAMIGQNYHFFVGNFTRKYRISKMHLRFP